MALFKDWCAGTKQTDKKKTFRTYMAGPAAGAARRGAQQQRSAWPSSADHLLGAGGVQTKSSKKFMLS